MSNYILTSALQSMFIPLTAAFSKPAARKLHMNVWMTRMSEYKTCW
ncbi:hypothetical protein HNQ36_002662 [Afipia massiliensis]|uniref:Uncharacterized protein n=1 Tax=Afipia massiliensis TaxID=211460 RepID=A0A840N496_9BRAD|nr:hypothetical protein [Afipia massiliensis]MBB5052688.1 hypothetical protein [Afipia massiliensis]